jgi:hypothetical protein
MKTPRLRSSSMRKLGVAVSNHQGPELTLLEQQQHVERVVDRLAGPVVAVVPGADLVPIEAFELRGEDLVEVGLGVAADGRVLRIDGDVAEIVQAREQADLTELADTCQKREADVGIGVLDDRIEVAQALAHGPCGLGVGDLVEDGLVVLVDQHHHALAVAGMGRAQQRGEAPGEGLAGGLNAQALGVDRKQLADLRLQLGAVAQHALAEAQAHHREASFPVPVPVGGKALKQRLVALEQLGQGIQEQGLAEAARSGQEIVRTLPDEAQGKVGLVDVVAIALANLAQGLDADGERLGLHAPDLGVLAGMGAV